MIVSLGAWAVFWKPDGKNTWSSHPLCTSHSNVTFGLVRKVLLKKSGSNIHTLYIIGHVAKISEPNIHQTHLYTFLVGKKMGRILQPLLNNTPNEHSFLEHPSEAAPMLLEDLLEVQIQSSTAPYPDSGANLAPLKDNGIWNLLTYQHPLIPSTKNVFWDPPCISGSLHYAAYLKLPCICIVWLPHIWVI